MPLPSKSLSSMSDFLEVRSLNRHEQNYGITDMEALGLRSISGHYGHQCTVFTDHAPLRALFKSVHPSGKLAPGLLAISSNS